MILLRFCPVDGFILSTDNKCPECDYVQALENEAVERPILGMFTDEDAERMKAIQNSGNGMPSC